MDGAHADRTAGRLDGAAACRGVGGSGLVPAAEKLAGFSQAIGIDVRPLSRLWHQLCRQRVRHRFAVRAGCARCRCYPCDALESACAHRRRAGCRHSLYAKRRRAELKPGMQIRAATFLGAEQISRIFATHLDAHTVARRTSHQLELCSNGLSLLLEPGNGADPDAPFAVDILNPCWIYRGADLSVGPRFTAAVAPLPFNYELGADAAKIRVGDARTAVGELEIHIDGCETPPITLPLAPAAVRGGVTVLPATRLPILAGRHDICLRFARPRLDPLWALDWVEIGE